MTQYSRRRFLEDSMFGAAALAASAHANLWADEKGAAPPQSKSHNEKLLVACIGVRGQGESHLHAYSGRKDTEVAIICDVDSKVGNQRCDEIAKRQNGRRPKYVQDLRRVFDDSAINCVSTATPNHWHALVAIWAMQSGKDVYVEKPVSHNVSEGRRMVQVARKLGRICQTGTQCRSQRGTIEAIEFVKSGQIGEVKVARGLCYKSRGSIGPRIEAKIPEHVDYNLWTGPAPVKPSYRNGKFGPVHYDWHWFWDYGNGDLGNQGIHQMDIARWGLGVDELSRGVISYGGRFGYEDAGETANTQVIIHDFGPKTLVFEVRGLDTKDLKGAKVGVIFEGSDGYVVLDNYTHGAAFDKNGKMIREFNGGGDHHGNFLAAVRSRKHEDLHADVLEGHLSSALCHLGNISYRLGSLMSASATAERLQGVKTNEDAAATLARTIEHLQDNRVSLDAATQFRVGEVLAFDSANETFPSNAAANAQLTREYRAPFVVPSASDI